MSLNDGFNQMCEALSPRVNYLFSICMDETFTKLVKDNGKTTVTLVSLCHFKCYLRQYQVILYNTQSYSMNEACIFSPFYVDELITQIDPCSCPLSCELAIKY